VRLTRAQRAKHLASPGGQAAILFTVGEFTFAVPADVIREIQGLQDLRLIASELTPIRSLHNTPAPGIGALGKKVRHTLHRGNRLHFVIDGNFFFGLPPSSSSRVLIFRGQPVGLKVDGIERMTMITQTVPLPLAFRGEERRWYAKLAIVENRVIPVLNTDALLSRLEITTLETLLARSEENIFSAVGS
jgi:chemotaxis signal transduction protein